MISQNKKKYSGWAEVDGDKLYYECYGEGVPILMIMGGGGDSFWYSYLAEILSDTYKVIIYDRRGYARSTYHEPQNFEVSQQSIDAIEVLKAAGEESAIIFGNSSGAVIALDIATRFPEAARAVIAHEPPLARVHPKSKKWQRFFACVYWLSWWNVGVAMAWFIFGVGFPVIKMIKAAKVVKADKEKRGLGRTSDELRENYSFFLKQELLPVTNYLPDINQIKNNKVSVCMAAGELSLRKKWFYAIAAKVLAEKMDCQFLLLPGHHFSFMDMAEEWAQSLKKLVSSFDVKLIK